MAHPTSVLATGQIKCVSAPLLHDGHSILYPLKMDFEIDLSIHCCLQKTALAGGTLCYPCEKLNDIHRNGASSLGHQHEIVIYGIILHRCDNCLRDKRAFITSQLFITCYAMKHDLCIGLDGNKYA